MIEDKKFQPKQFNGSERPRSFQWNENDVILCDRYARGASNLVGNVPVTEFTTNKTLVLLGKFITT